MGENDKKPEVYANAITVSSTFFDFTLSFKKEIVFETEGGKQEKEMEDVSFIRVSPQMAKALAVLLNNNISSYEEKYGPIPDFPKN